MAHHYCIVDIKHSKSFNVSFLLASDQLSAADDDMPFQTPSLTSSALSEALATRAREMFSCCCGILRENACQICLPVRVKGEQRPVKWRCQDTSEWPEWELRGGTTRGSGG